VTVGGKSLVVVVVISSAVEVVEVATMEVVVAATAVVVVLSSPSEQPARTTAAAISRTRQNQTEPTADMTFFAVTGVIVTSLAETVETARSTRIRSPHKT